MLLANLMLRNVVCTQISLRTSGSECSKMPAKLPFVQSVADAPWKPSKTEPSWKLRFMSTPQLLREAGSSPCSVNLTGVLAVIGHVRTAVGVVQRVRRAVAVDLRDDEDVEVVDERRRLGHRSRSCARAAPWSRGRRPRSRSRCRAPGSTGTRRPWSRRAACRCAACTGPAGRAGTSPGRAAGRSAASATPGWHDAGAGCWSGTAARTTRLETCGWALIAATTCAAVLVTAPLASVAGLMRIVAGEGDAQRLVGRARRRSDDLGREAVAALVALGLRGQDDRAGLLRRGRRRAGDRQVVGVEADVRRRSRSVRWCSC